MTLFPARSVESRRTLVVPPETIFGANAKGIWDHRIAYDANGASSLWDDQGVANANLIQNDGVNHPSEVSVAGVAGGARFNGSASGQYLSDNAGAASTFRISTTAYFICIVGKAPAALATEVDATSDGPMIADSGGWIGMSWSTTPRMWHFDSAQRQTPAAALANDALFAALGWFDGTTIHFKITGSVEKTIAATTIGGTTGALRLARPWTGTKRGGGDIAACYVGNVSPSSPQRTQLDDWINSIWGVRFSS